MQDEVIARTSRVRLTRKSWARYMLPAVILAAIISGVAIWLTGEYRYTRTPLGLLCVWGVLRVLTPSEGRSCSTVRETPGMLTLVCSCAVSLLLGAILMAVDICVFGKRLGDPLELYHAALYLPPFVLLFTGAYWSERQARKAATDHRRS